ncbi:hypothetical protein ACH5Y9_14255 [Methylomonas sp. BW4-1]|uniref:hypothetical protein n=1 Tax=unclassified Methylomonas TaxID=2608980 RepID=UPI00051C4225|nr:MULTISPECIES: hypothetical protein [unclassified Methylomonas]PKD41911.1 hypothetical protein CWO84_02455 [Methylomonas sp. Kb3]QBC26695.1 hypothetical protein U737_07105 [Methylomonas sp. LW13]
MKSEQLLLAAGALLLVWSVRSEAHSSYEAMLDGGNLPQLTRAALHPLFEVPDLPTLLISVLILGFVFGPVILHIARQRHANKAQHPPLSEKSAIAPKTKHL